jgi:hypothetical protein
MNETYSNGGALDRSIYSRRVPGISNGELVEALERGDKPRDTPTVNDAFSRTSPSIYQHFQNANVGAMNTPYANSVLAEPTMAAAANAQPDPIGRTNAIAQPSASEQDVMRTVRRRLGDLDASVREYHAKEIARHGQVLETLDAFSKCMKMRTWAMAIVGAVVIGLIVLLLCMVSKVSYGLSVHAASNGHADTKRSTQAMLRTAGDSESTA